jgi:flagella basal body P-ring formation protein FlgA
VLKALGFLLAAGATAAAPAAAEPSVALPEILTDVAALLEERARNDHPEAEIEVSLQPLDPRLSLADCSDVELAPRGANTHGRVAVGVRCYAPQNWSIFLTGDVKVMQPVVVTQVPIRRGELIRPAMLGTETRDLSRLRNLYYTDTAAVVGKEARRHFAAGSVLFASQLKAPLAVERGQRVQIVARSGTVEISSRGEALEDGSLGEQIRVRNLQSERIVFAWIDAPGRVVTRRSGAEQGADHGD